MREVANEEGGAGIGRLTMRAVGPGALGGVLGVLPFLAVARSAAVRVFPPSGLPGAERWAGEIKEATYLEVAVLFTIVPLAAVVFGVFLPRFLQARGWSWWRSQLPGMGLSVGLLFWRIGLGALVSLGLGVAGSALTLLATRLRVRRWLVLLGLSGVFVAGIAANGSGTGLDLFEDGQILVGAQTLAHGGRPFLDTYPIHGWGADGGWDAALFRVFGERLDVFRGRRTIMTALAITLLAGASLLFFKVAGWAVLGFLACLAVCPFLSERQMLPFLTLAVFIHAARSSRTTWWLIAGVLAGMTVFSTLDFGMIFLLTGAAAPLVLSVLSREPLRRAMTAASRFGLGVLASSAPFLLYLACRGALGAFFSVSFREIPSEVSAAWGLPAPSLTQVAREGTLEALAGPSARLWLILAALAVASSLLALRAASGGIAREDRAAALCALIGIVALRGALGRSEPAHWMLYGVFAGLPATWLLQQAAASWRSHRLIVGGAALAFLVLVRPDHVLRRQTALVIGARERHAAERRTGVRLPSGALLGRDQASDMQTLRATIDRFVPPTQTFFEFGNQPGLYFLLNRRVPVRYATVPSYETPAKQHEVIAILERERPPLAVIASGTLWDTVDGVANQARAPLVAAYLDAHYHRRAQLGARTLGLRDP